MVPVVSLERASRVFRTDRVETRAVHEVSLQVEAGEFLQIRGRSGAGKSTLLALLGLLEPLDAGVRRVVGADTAGLTSDQLAALRNKYFGFVFQRFHLVPDRSIGENVALPLTLRGVGASDALAAAEGKLERVGLGHRMHHLPAQLSGGEQQRAAVARAMVGAPAVIFADEPTGSLDSTSGDAVMELLAAARQGGATVVVVTHELRHASLASRWITVHDGVITDQG
ncbi:MAG: ABC transporter ATP-binding protein [Gemmatimonadaceae bacterium]|nr:ABC transporter ATP-binding protein [Gemmatimonadaceae bacterium]